ncbi:MAG TPA: hypothetical protein VIN93_04595 [Bryobacteraceae bacterium]
MMTSIELAQNEKKLQADEQKLGSLREADNRAQAAHDEAHALDDRLQNNVDAGLKVSDKEKAAARAAHAAAHDAMEKSAAALAAHVAAIGDPGLRARALGEEAALLEQERMRVAYRSAADEALVAIVQAMAAENKLRAILSEAYSRFPEAATTAGGERLERGAGLVPLAFPDGVFTPTRTSIGMRSLVRDGLLHAYVVAGFTDLLEKHFTQDEVAAIIGKLERERAAGVTYIPGRQDRWEVFSGDLHGISRESLPNFFSLPFRRDHFSY